MNMRERHQDDRQSDERDASGDNAGDANLRRMRLAGESLLAAGADAIQRALSGNSESFLKATRQQGGQ